VNKLAYAILILVGCWTVTVEADPTLNTTPEASPGSEPSAATDEDAWTGPRDQRPATELGVIRLNTLLQTRYVSTVNSASTHPIPSYALRENYLVRQGDGFQLRRAYLRMNASPTPWFMGRVVLDFAKFERGGIKRLVRQAYGQFAAIPDHLEIAVGVVKLPLSIMKLDSAARFELADAGPLTELASELDFAGRDVGLRVMLAPFNRAKLARLTLGVYRGHAYDEHASPLSTLGARLESKPVKGLRLGLSVVHQPYDLRYRQPFETSDEDVLPVASDPAFPRAKSWASGSAWSADATFHRKRLMVRAEGMLGDRVDVDERYGARSFYGAWALLSYRVSVGSVQLMPAARAEWLDADADHDVGARRTYTLALNVILSAQVRLLFDATHTDVDAQSPVIDARRPLTELPYFELDHTRATGQLQVEI
jgi:hypothetical protein